MACILWI